MRKKLKETEKKGKLTASINKQVLDKVNSLHGNVFLVVHLLVLLFLHNILTKVMKI